jgi:hypothetical protein
MAASWFAHRELAIHSRPSAKLETQVDEDPEGRMENQGARTMMLAAIQRVFR